MTAGQHAAPRFRRFRVWPRPAALRTEAEVPAQVAPAADATMIWRIPDPTGGPGLILPPGAPWAQDQEDPEDREPLPQRTPGADIPPAKVPALRTEPADRDILREVADALRALPGDPEPAGGEDGEDEGPAPAAYLRAVVPDGEVGVTQIQDALGHSPLFAGSGTLADGRTVAGMYLGTNEDGWFVVDALSVEWCEDAITALTAMRDALVAARDGEPEGEEAA